MNGSKATIYLLRISIASVFIYAAVAATIEPGNWIGYIPSIFRRILPGDLLLTLFSIYQALLALWVLSGKKSFYSSILSSLTFLAIILANYQQIDILFRDIAIFFSTLALALASRKAD